MANQRGSVQDFMSAVRQAGQSGNFNYGASLNADNTTVKVTQTPKTGGVAVALFPKVLWNVSTSAALTDASSPNQDTVTIYSPDGGTNTGACQQFLNSLP